MQIQKSLIVLHFRADTKIALELNYMCMLHIDLFVLEIDLCVY